MLRRGKPMLQCRKKGQADYWCITSSLLSKQCIEILLFGTRQDKGIKEWGRKGETILKTLRLR